jgi:hypothetical protein
MDRFKGGGKQYFVILPRGRKRGGTFKHPSDFIPQPSPLKGRIFRIIFWAGFWMKI